MAGSGKPGRKSIIVQSGDGMKSVPPVLRTMLSLLPMKGTIAACARLMDVPYSRIWGLHRPRIGKHVAYTAAYDAALEEATQLLEREALRRACEGVGRLKFHQGKPIMIINPQTGREEYYVEHEYSDSLLMFILKSRRPDVYREHFDGRIEHRGQVGVKVSGVLAVDTPARTSTEWEQKAK